MIVHQSMSLPDLAERMGSTATDNDAERMRFLLVAEGYIGTDTNDIPCQSWHSLLNQACDYESWSDSGYDAK